MIQCVINARCKKNGKRKTENGKRKTESGKRKAESGKRKAESGKRKVIGVMPSDRRRPNAFPLRRKDGEASRGRMLHANNFCKHYAIRPTETLAFINPEINNNGILILNLHEVRSVKKV